MSAADDVVKALEGLPLGDLLAVASAVVNLIRDRSNAQQAEIDAMRASIAASEAAIDAELTKGGS